MLVEDCKFAGPSRFWIEYSPRRNQSNFPVNRAVFRRNRIHNVVTPAIGEAQIVFTQGDGLDHEVLLEDNDIRDCPDVFAFYCGAGGPVTIRDNTLTDCGTALSFGVAPGYINTNDNTRVTFENNRVERGRMLVYFFAQASAVAVRDNVFIGKDAANLGLSTAVFYGVGVIANNTVERNVFMHCRTPEQTAGIEGQRPLFRDNRYLNVEVSGTDRSRCSPPARGRRIPPRSSESGAMAGPARSSSTTSRSPRPRPRRPPRLAPRPGRPGRFASRGATCPDNVVAYGLETRSAAVCDAPWLPLATPAVRASDYLHSGLAPGSRHAYRLTAVNAYGSSAPVLASARVWPDFEAWRHGVWCSAS